MIGWLNDLISWSKKYDGAPRPKWRDEKSIWKLFSPILLVAWLVFLVEIGLAKTNLFEYPLSVFAVVIFYMIGQLKGIESGKEIEQLWPSKKKHENWDYENHKEIS